MDERHEINERALRRTDKLILGLNELLGILLTDAATDVEVVARELGLKDEMRERLRRALDRVECAQSVAESLHGGFPRNEALSNDPVRKAMETLACMWPHDYSVDAVDWLLLDER